MSTIRAVFWVLVLAAGFLAYHDFYFLGGVAAGRQPAFWLSRP